MNLKEALKRIEALEREMVELKARPVSEFHYHYISAPTQPAPERPQWPYPNYIWCVAGGEITSIGHTGAVG